MSAMAAAATRPIMGLVMYSCTPLAEAAGEKIREYLLSIMRTTLVTCMLTVASTSVPLYYELVGRHVVVPADYLQGYRKPFKHLLDEHVARRTTRDAQSSHC